jgi:hypothetical protein
MCVLPFLLPVYFLVCDVVVTKDALRGCLNVRFCVRFGVRFAAKGVRQVFFFWLKCVNKPLKGVTEKEMDSYSICVQIVQGIVWRFVYAESDRVNALLVNIYFCSVKL